jgi:hypothetical protein
MRTESDPVTAKTRVHFLLFQAYLEMFTITADMIAMRMRPMYSRGGMSTHLHPKEGINSFPFTGGGRMSLFGKRLNKAT